MLLIDKILPELRKIDGSPKEVIDEYYNKLSETDISTMRDEINSMKEYKKEIYANAIVSIANDKYESNFHNAIRLVDVSYVDVLKDMHKKRKANEHNRFLLYSEYLSFKESKYYTSNINIFDISDRDKKRLGDIYNVLIKRIVKDLTPTYLSACKDSDTEPNIGIQNFI